MNTGLGKLTYSKIYCKLFFELFISTSKIQSYKGGIVPNSIRNRAKKLVGLICQYVAENSLQNGLRGRPGNERAVFFQVLEAAGFQPRSLVVGHMTSTPNLLGADGKPVGPYSVNQLTQIVVVTEQGEDELATGWFDDLVEEIVDRISRQWQTEAIVDLVADAIKKSIPLSPIHLSGMGDLLIEQVSPRTDIRQGGYLVKRAQDSHNFEGRVGTHAGCNGFLVRMPVGVHRDAIACQNCQLWVPIPNSVMTYGDVRKFLAGLQPKPKKKIGKRRRSSAQMPKTKPGTKLGSRSAVVPRKKK